MDLYLAIVLPIIGVLVAIPLVFHYVRITHIVNYYTKEIHKIETSDTRCHIHNMTHCGYINRIEMRRLLKNGYNGCRHCLQELDTDYINNKKKLKK